MVFQSERVDGNPFFQIFVMDLETGDVEQISPGHGKTTCAWIHPDGNQVLFASTHDDAAARDKQAAELTARERGQARRYSWDYDETFELYSYDRRTKQTKRITSSPGYDAGGFLVSGRSVDRFRFESIRLRTRSVCQGCQDF